MPRGKRYIVPGHTYHVTHRCHGKAYFFQYGVDRTQYRKMLRDRLQRYQVSLFSYCITSNHVHLLLRPDPSDALTSLSRLMQSLEGDFAQFYNIKHRREDAFWGDRYHATMVESGEHLWRCLLYIDLNMVRAGVVEHPSQWEWTAYRELTGLRQRYRLVDRDRLLEHLGGIHFEYFKEHYIGRVGEAIRRRKLTREAAWTAGLAVGSESYANRVGRLINNRVKVQVLQATPDSSTWLVKEEFGTYG